MERQRSIREQACDTIDARLADKSIRGRSFLRSLTRKRKENEGDWQ